MPNDHANSTTAADRLGEARLGVAGPSVVHEMLDGEVIVIHLERGFYYSLQDVAGQLWMKLTQSRSVDEIVDELAPRCGATPEVMRYAVLSFVDRLLQEQLLAPRGDALPSPLPVPPAPAELPAAIAQALAFQRFDDVAELLKLDPVHDVDDVGWPIKAGP